jgi:hypothetical protein
MSQDASDARPGWPETIWSEVNGAAAGDSKASNDLGVVEKCVLIPLPILHCSITPTPHFSS